MSVERSVLLFIPAYNCEKQIVRLLTSLPAKLSACIKEVIIVDNRSADGTATAAARFIRGLDRSPVTWKVLQNRENYGLGGSHKVAFRYACERPFAAVVTLHGDDQADLSDFRTILDSWSSGAIQADAILGSRFSRRSAVSGYRIHRHLGNIVLNAVWSALLLRVVTDIGSGLNAVSCDLIRRIDLAELPDTLIFNPQQLLAFIEQRAAIRFEPISWREEDQRSNAVPWRVFAGAVRQVAAYRFLRPLGIRPPRAARTEYPYDVIAEHPGGAPASERVAPSAG